MSEFLKLAFVFCQMTNKTLQLLSDLLGDKNVAPTLWNDFDIQLILVQAFGYLMEWYQQFFGRVNILFLPNWFLTSSRWFVCVAMVTYLLMKWITSFKSSRIFIAKLCCAVFFLLSWKDGLSTNMTVNDMTLMEICFCCSIPGLVMIYVT